MAVGIKPLADKVVIKPGQEEEKTPGGIVLPDTAKRKPQEGEVLAVGPGKWEEGKRIPVDVAVGDTVIYSKYAGTEIKVDGEDVVILDADQILAVKEKK